MPITRVAIERPVVTSTVPPTFTSVPLKRHEVLLPASERACPFTYKPGWISDGNAVQWVESRRKQAGGPVPIFYGPEFENLKARCGVKPHEWSKGAMNAARKLRLRLMRAFREAQKEGAQPLPPNALVVLPYLNVFNVGHDYNTKRDIFQAQSRVRVFLATDKDGKPVVFEETARKALLRATDAYPFPLPLGESPDGGRYSAGVDVDDFLKSPIPKTSE